jgi:predicted CopG family antitoxin
MANNEPIANVQPPANVLRAPQRINAGSDRDVNRSESLQQNIINRMRKEIESERKGRVSAEKKLADSDLLVDKLKLEATSLLSKFKHEKQTFSDLLKSQKVLNKKQLDAEAVMTAAQVQHKKEAQASKAAVTKELKNLTLSYRTLEKVSIVNKTKISALNFAQTAWMKTRADLQFECRKLARELKNIKKKLDDQLGVKLDHDLSIQKLRNDSK